MRVAYSGTTPTPDNSTITLTVNMTDSYGDGWNGNIIGIRQNNYIVATFGNDFKTGKTFGPSNITISANFNAEIVVAQKGSYTSEVGFTVIYSNGTVIYK